MGFNKKKWILAIVLVLLGVVTLLCVIGGRALQAMRREARVDTIATAVVETALTERYGEEVSGAIERFTTYWFSLEAFTHPEEHSAIVIDPRLLMMGEARYELFIHDLPQGLFITREATVEWLRVLEYTPEDFKAVASLRLLGDQVTWESVQVSGDQVMVESRVTQADVEEQFCGVFAFTKDEGVWKLAALFGTKDYLENIERDWIFVDSGTREVLGELPDGPLCTPWPWRLPDGPACTPWPWRLPDEPVCAP
jgi:hypothetical protein